MAKIQKRLILICAAVLMLVTLLLLAVTASAAAWDGTIASSFAGGSGSSADPYRISNGAELAYLADRVNGGEDFQGLFGVSTGYIRVVQIENADISGNNFVGGICGQNTGDIVASYVKNSTKVKVTEGVLDENGAYSFKADEGKNYTLVIK